MGRAKAFPARSFSSGSRPFFRRALKAGAAFLPVFRRFAARCMSGYPPRKPSFRRKAGQGGESVAAPYDRRLRKGPAYGVPAASSVRACPSYPLTQADTVPALPCVVSREGIAGAGETFYRGMGFIPPPLQAQRSHRGISSSAAVFRRRPENSRPPQVGAAAHTCTEYGAET